MNEQCPHIVGRSSCEICAEERVNELEDENNDLRQALKDIRELQVSPQVWQIAVDALEPEERTVNAVRMIHGKSQHFEGKRIGSNELAKLGKISNRENYPLIRIKLFGTFKNKEPDSFVNLYFMPDKPDVKPEIDGAYLGSFLGEAKEPAMLKAPWPAWDEEFTLYIQNPCSDEFCDWWVIIQTETYGL
jgi:hypothetical protein